MPMVSWHRVKGKAIIKIILCQYHAIIKNIINIITIIDNSYLPHKAHVQLDYLHNYSLGQLPLQTSAKLFCARKQKSWVWPKSCHVIVKQQLPAILIGMYGG